MPKVLLTDNIAQKALDVFAEYSDIEAVSVGTLEPDELAAILPEYEAVIVRSPTKLTKELIDAGLRLKYIGRAGVGVDNIDIEAATARGIVVMNAPFGNIVSTAEHTIAMMLALARRIPQADRSVRAKEWERSALKGVELDDKTLGIIGIGRVGREVARRMLAFNMRVVASDPFVTEEDAAKMGIQLQDLDTVLRDGDFITVHVPLGAGTRGLIGDPEIAKMKDGVFLINCARGGVVDEDAVARAIERGKIAGIAFDVYENEPPGDNPLLGHERSVFTPHLGAATSDAQVRVAVDAARSVAKALTTGETENAVNAGKS
jgi:D-3-phosphoglycerate dehydrogenase